MPAYCSEKRSHEIQQSHDGWTARRVWFVTDAGSELEALTSTPLSGSTPIPQINESHPLNQNLKVRSVTPQASPTTPRAYDVQVEYGYPSGGEYTTGDDDLTKRLPVITWRDGRISMPTDRDIYGRPIVNSAWDAFDPPPQRNIKVKYLTITRYENGYDYNRLSQYENTVNSNSWRSGPTTFYPGDVLCASIIPDESYTTTSKIIRIAYNFEIIQDWRMTEGGTIMRIEEPWQTYLKDAGRRGWGDVSGTKKLGELVYSTEASKSVADDVALDGAGKPIDSNLKVTLDGTTPYSPISPAKSPWPSSYIMDFSTNDAKFIRFRLLPMRDFSELKL